LLRREKKGDRGERGQQNRARKAGGTGALEGAQQLLLVVGNSRKNGFHETPPERRVSVEGKKRACGEREEMFIPHRTQTQGTTGSHDEGFLLRSGPRLLSGRRPATQCHGYSS
jgi:hypothetical protein